MNAGLRRFEGRVLRRAAVSGLPLPGLVQRARGATDKVVFLTFDDGPLPETTPRILDLLAQHGAHATFFVVGQRVEENPALAQRIAREGHVLGNHTQSHPRLVEIGRERCLEEVARCERALDGLARGGLFRPTYGMMHFGLYRRLVSDGMRIAYWTLDSAWFDAATRGAALLGRVRPREIVLMHDHSHADIEALRTLLPTLRDRGYRFEALA